MVKSPEGQVSTRASRGGKHAAAVQQPLASVKERSEATEARTQLPGMRTARVNELLGTGGENHRASVATRSRPAAGDREQVIQEQAAALAAAERPAKRRAAVVAASVVATAAASEEQPETQFREAQDVAQSRPLTMVDYGDRGDVSADRSSPTAVAIMVANRPTTFKVGLGLRNHVHI